MAQPDLKIGIIGCGRIALVGHGLPYKLHPSTQVTAVCDIREDAARALGKQVGAKNIYTDPEKMLAKENLDLVSICTPPWLHQPQAEMALDAGCHVLLEKPMCLDVDAAERLQLSASRSKQLLMLSYHKRFDPGVMATRQLLEKNSYGENFHAEFTWRGLWTVAKVPWVEQLRKIGDMAGVDSSSLFPSWRDDDPKSPGATATIFCHLVDLAISFFGTPLHWQGESVAVRGRKPDHLLLTLRFEGGRTAQCRMSAVELSFDEKEEGRFFCTEGNLSYTTDSNRQGLLPARVVAQYAQGPLPRTKDHTPGPSAPPWKDSTNYRKVAALVTAIENGESKLPPHLPGADEGALVDRIIHDLVKNNG